MKVHELIKNLRIKQGLLQSEVAKDIMSRSAYSKFELGERALTTLEFDQVLERLDAHITDLTDLENMENPSSRFIRKLTRALHNNQLDLEQLTLLYPHLKKQKDHSLKDYRNYLYIKHQFKDYPDIVEPITKDEMNNLFVRIKKKKYLTNYYIQIIMDFASHFTSEQLIHFLERLKGYKVDWISAIDCQYLHLLPGAISNITDSLIDQAVLDTPKVNFELLGYAKESCDKLTEIIKLRPSFDYSLLAKLFRIKLEYYYSTNEQEKKNALNKATELKKEVEFISTLKSYEQEPIQSTAAIVLASINNLLLSGLPGDTKYFFV